MTITPEHDKANRRYVLRVGAVGIGHDDNEVVLRYQMLDDDTIDFTSTFTPKTLRGQGLARGVVEHAIEDALANGLTLKASCWYAEKILKERQTITQ